MAKRRPAYARELPTVSWADWNHVRRVKMAMNELERGVFDQAAQIVDAMGRDDRIEGELAKRTGALLGLPMTFKPMGDGRSNPKVARECEESFELMYPEGARAELLKWGIMLGVGIAQNVWESGVERWTPTLRVWHPRHLTWNDTDEAFHVQTLDGPRTVTPGDGEWILFTPYGRQRPWMKGALRSLYVPWLLRQWAMRDWGRASEVYGQPTRKAVTPMGADGEDKDRFLREVALIGSETVIRTPRTGSEDADRYDLELVEATVDFSGAFKELIDKADICVTVRLLGQNLTTEVRGGSYAAAYVHNSIRQDLLRGDAKAMGMCLHEQSLTWWAQYNHGSKDLAPIPGWLTEPPEDRKAKGEALESLGKGIQSLQSIGAKPDVDKILDEAGIPVTAKAGPPLPPAGSNPLNDQEDDEKPTPGQEAAPGGKKGGRPKLRAASLQVSQNRPALEAQMYLDEVVEEGSVAARDALAPDLRKILDIIESSEVTDYEGLRKALLKSYPKAKPKQLAAVMEKCLIMAELAGRHAVLEEL
jgi:phage gp29-like protein